MGQASLTASEGVLPGDAHRRSIADSSLWRRIGFVVAALLVYRLGSYITLPGIDLSGLFDLRSPVSKEIYQRISIFGLGLWPYISASIFIQVVIWVARMTPKLMEVERRKRINTYIRGLTIILTLLQGYMIAIGLIATENNSNISFVSFTGPLFIISTMFTLTAGTIFLVWLAEEITKRGLGNGVMLMLAVEILVDMPLNVSLFAEKLGGYMSVDRLPPATPLIIAAVFLAAIALMAFVENARLDIPVRFPGQKSASGADREEQLLVRLNQSTIYSPILASSFVLLPITLMNFTYNGEAGWQRTLAQSLFTGEPLHMILFAVMIMLLTYAFLPNMGTAQAIAGSLARRGGEIPGVPPGAPTAAYIRQNLKWASVPVPFYMAIICLLPEVMNRLIGLPMMINGLNLFIVVFALNDVLHGVRQARSGSVTSDLATRQFDATK